jgi:hypothetical protein
MLENPSKLAAYFCERLQLRKQFEVENEDFNGEYEEMEYGSESEEY